MAPVRLLLVDDDESVLSGLSVLLEAHDFQVTTAANVVEALQHIVSESFDVLLSDLHMPGQGDGLIVVGAMRHAQPQAIRLVLSANPDMAKATTAVLRMVDEVILKPAKAGPIVETIRRRLAEKERPGEQTGERAAPRQGERQEPEDGLQQQTELVAAVLERERSGITRAWLERMDEVGSLKAAGLDETQASEHLPEALNEIVYRLRYPQPLGLMTLFSMASLQHGARRRRQGVASPVLVEEARALQAAVFQAVEGNLGRIELSQLPAALMAIADEVNAQLLQSLSGYENEKPAEYPVE